MNEKRIGGEMIKGHIATLALAIIGERPQHGYEIMKTLAERTHGAFELGQGTIYPLLYGLEEQGLLRSKESLIDGRRRRIYSLTGAGRKALGERRQGWKLFQAAMNSVLKPLTMGGTVDVTS